MCTEQLQSYNWHMYTISYICTLFSSSCCLTTSTSEWMGSWSLRVCSFCCSWSRRDWYIPSNSNAFSLAFSSSAYSKKTALLHAKDANFRTRRWITLIHTCIKHCNYMQRLNAYLSVINGSTQFIPALCKVLHPVIHLLTILWSTLGLQLGSFRSQSLDWLLVRLYFCCKGLYIKKEQSTLQIRTHSCPIQIVQSPTVYVHVLWHELRYSHMKFKWKVKS